MRKIYGTKIAIASMLGALLVITNPVTSSAATCTKSDISDMLLVDFSMASASLSGDLTKVFNNIAKAKKATKSKALKTFYSELEAAIEADNGVLKVGKSRDMWRTLQAKRTYKRC